MQALDKPNDLRARVEFHFGIKKSQGIPGLQCTYRCRFAGTYMFPATTAVYTLPISAALIILGTRRGGLSLLGVPPGDGIPTTPSDDH